MRVKNYKFTGGKNSETAGIKNILLNLGITSKFNNQPFTEDFLLGVGGGIRSSYFIFELKSGPFPAIGARHLLESNNFNQDICRRLKIPAILKESTSKKLALNDLTSTLNEGIPALAWTDLASLPYYHYSEEMVKYFIHVLVVTGFDEKSNKFIIDDRSQVPIKIPAEILENARSAISSLKNRLLVAKTPLHEPNLKNAITEGIKHCCEGMLYPRLKNFGLESLKEWAQALTSNDNRHSWSNLFINRADLYQALINIFHFIESATDGSALRRMYSEFLQTSDDILVRAELKESSDHFKTIALLWTKLANTALDDSIPLFQETKELLIQRNNLFNEKGQRADSDLKKISKRIFQLKKISSHEFPLNSSDVLDLFSEMHKLIMKIYHEEKSAIETLQKKIIS